MPARAKKKKQSQARTKAPLKPTEPPKTKRTQRRTYPSLSFSAPPGLEQAMNAHAADMGYRSRSEYVCDLVIADLKKHGKYTIQEKKLLRITRRTQGESAVTRSHENAERLDPVKHFFEQCCELDPESYETKDDIFAAFERWRGERNVPIMYRDWFFRNLKTRFGLRSGRFREIGRQPCMVGMKLKDT